MPSLLTAIGAGIQIKVIPYSSEILSAKSDLTLLAIWAF